MIFIVSLSVICLILLVVLIKKESKFARRMEENDILINAQEEHIRREKGNYLALEQGMDEQEENYESMILSLQEMVTKYRRSFLEAQEEVERHRSECLPNIADVTTLDMQGL